MRQFAKNAIIVCELSSSRLANTSQHARTTLQTVSKNTNVDNKSIHFRI